MLHPWSAATVTVCPEYTRSGLLGEEMVIGVVDEGFVTVVVMT